MQELSTEAPNISEDAVQLMKFHGSYMQVRRASRMVVHLCSACGSRRVRKRQAAPVCVLCMCMQMHTGARCACMRRATCCSLRSLFCCVGLQPHSKQSLCVQTTRRPVPCPSSHDHTPSLLHPWLQDNREERTFGAGKSYQFMMRTRQPAGTVTNQLYLVMDELADLVRAHFLVWRFGQWRTW